METRISSATKEVIISAGQPTVLIGERINPTGRKKLSAALRAGDWEIIRQEALSQVQGGADILDVNASADGVDEVALLPKVVQIVMDTVDVPLCLDSPNPEALQAALKVYKGKPLINSVTGSEHSLNSVLPLVKEYGAAVVGLTQDDDGVPGTSDKRVAIAHKIVERASALGIVSDDIIIDCLALTVAVDTTAGLVTLDTIRKVKSELGVNITMGISNTSFGLPDRDLFNNIFLAMAIAAGVTCPIVNVSKARAAALAADLVLGYDEYAARYIKAYRQRLQSGT